MKKLIPLFLLLFSASAYAQDTGSGLDFLNIGPSARLLSISDGGTAALTGPSAIYTNPSLLAFDSTSSLDLNYTLWIADVTNQFAAVNFRKNRWALGFGVFNSMAENFEARDRAGPSQGLFSISYLSLSAAGAYRIGNLSAGVTLQYLREEVFQFRANGYAFNAGLSSEFLDGRVRAGVAVRNLGEMEKLDVESTTLPSSFHIGLSGDIIEFTTPGANDLPILLSLHADWHKPLETIPTADYTRQNDDEGYLSVALSADISDIIFLQGGYIFGPTERPVSFGLGLGIDPIRVNYALVPFTTGFGTVHSIGLQFYF